jgi:SynChlorMet cassette radical SAM/SPASM protein ScmF
MYITSGCNLACRHCWIAPTFEQDGGTGQCLDYDLYKRAIEEAMPLGLTRIKFTGGEPLLHPDFVRMVDYATGKGLKMNLETNGTLITRELAFYLKENTSMHHVAVSLDGAAAATHDYLRNVPGSFEKARQGVEYLVEAGYKPQVITSLFPDNVDEIEPLIQWTLKTGCGSVKFNIIQSCGRGAQMKERESRLAIEELISLGRWIEKELQKRFPIPLLFSWPMAFFGIRRLHTGSDGNCNIFHILGVLSSGDLAMCGIGTQEKELVYGRLGRENVAEVWTSNPGLVRLRELIPGQLEGICSRCIFKNRCLGACAALNFHEARSLTAPFWFCRQAEEAELFPPKRVREIENQKKIL